MNIQTKFSNSLRFPPVIGAPDMNDFGGGEVGVLEEYLVGAKDAWADFGFGDVTTSSFGGTAVGGGVVK